MKVFIAITVLLTGHAQAKSADSTRKRIRGPPCMASGERVKNIRNNKEVTSASGVFSDSVCDQFCDQFFSACKPANPFLTKPVARGGGRQLVETAEEPLPRVDDLSMVEDAMEDCHRTCMLWPRPESPDDYSNVDQSQDIRAIYGQSLSLSGFGGDTFWCRQRHLDLVGDPDSAAFHCYHASATGGSICRDSLVNDYTPYESLRHGQPTRRRLGNCNVALDDIVAECTDSGVTGDNLGLVLQMLPSTIEIIFLSGNDINDLEEDIFLDNLVNPSIVQAIYLNDCNLQTLHPNSLNGLPDLKVFDASGNQVSLLPGDFLKGKTELLQFSMWGNSFSGAIPQDIFRDTKKLERMMLYANDWDEIPDGTFKGLTKLEIMSWAGCNFGDDSFSDDVFDDLISLQFFDFIDGNPGLTTIKKRWFEGRMGRSLIRLAMWGSPSLAVIEEGVFDNLQSLEMVNLHGTKITSIDDMSQLLSKPNFKILTLG
mmetsp:Transcript_1545/g.2839  ORF Transcript_1545/g.2839 Transcript_1545/m.2839 type:complete len:483 (-) Transcript_1545:1061-2509(-)